MADSRLATKNVKMVYDFIMTPKGTLLFAFGGC